MPIGYYVHHHGAGHATRARAIAEFLGERLTRIGTGLGDGPGCIDLPDDRRDVDFSGDDGTTRPAWLHYAPLHHRGVQQRNARITAWIAETRPSLMVVDVSVEVACLARLCGVPVIAVRLLGDRTDAPHLGAFSDALSLLAPFPAILDDPALPGWIAAKTFHAGFIAPVQPGATRAAHDVVVLLGRGGSDIAAADIAAAAAATPGRRWYVLGAMDPESGAPANLTHLGWVAEPGCFLSSETILVAPCGDGAVAIAAAAGCRLIAIPQNRPHNEQQAIAAALVRSGATIACRSWPPSPLWPELLDRATKHDPAALAALHNPGAAAQAAAFILRQTV